MLKNIEEFLEPEDSKPVRTATFINSPAEDLATALYYVEQLETNNIDLTDSYDDWVKIGFSLASLGEDGRSLYHRVSALYGDYRERETDLKFTNLLLTASGKVTIASFIRFCLDQGVSRYTVFRGKKSLDVTIKETLNFIRDDEKGLAGLAHAMFKDQLSFNHTKDLWMFYQDGYWQTDEKRTVRLLIVDSIQSHLNYCLRELIDGLKDLDPQEQGYIKAAEDNIKMVRKYLAKLNTRRFMENVVNLATSFLPSKSIEYDTNPLILNLKNGTYSFADKTKQEHSHRDMLTKQIPINYNPEAVCPNWEAFLKKIFNDDASLISFVQKCVGYSLTGLTDMQTLLFCYGSGANGKSTFFYVLQMLTGDFYVTMPINILIQQDQASGTAPYYLSQLKGARAVVTSEIPRSKKLHESQVKDLTGGDLISARNPHEKPYFFKPTHKLWMFGNHKLEVESSDHGIWRRIRLIPFTYTFSDSEKLPMSKVCEMFEIEREGILKWAIDGFHKFREDGEKVPEAVSSATEEYKKESDVIGHFVKTCLTESKSQWAPMKEVFSSYQYWCDTQEQIQQFSRSAEFSKALRARGLAIEAKTDNVAHLKGYLVKTDWTKPSLSFGAN